MIDGGWYIFPPTCEKRMMLIWLLHKVEITVKKRKKKTFLSLKEMAIGNFMCLKKVYY